MCELHVQECMGAIFELVGIVLILQSLSLVLGVRDLRFVLNSLLTFLCSRIRELSI